jgi:hypothetical protein
MHAWQELTRGPLNFCPARASDGAVKGLETIAIVTGLVAGMIAIFDVALRIRSRRRERRGRRDGRR